MRQLVNNSDLEIRVEALEEEMVDLTSGLALANDDINNLQDSQIVQDERFVNVEDDITNLDADVGGKSLKVVC